MLQMIMSCFKSKEGKMKMTAREIFTKALEVRRSRLLEAKTKELWPLCVQLDNEIEMITILFEKFGFDNLLDVEGRGR